MKILQYNIFEGVQNQARDRRNRTAYSRLKHLVKMQQPDVVCLQEANGWLDDDCARLHDFAEHTGFPESWGGVFPGIFDKNGRNSSTRFNLVTLHSCYTAFPDSPFGRYIRNPAVFNIDENGDRLFWHAALRGTVKLGNDELDIWNIHLDPRGENERLTEAKHLVSMIDMSRLAIICGDFNSLSRADDYPPDFFAKLPERVKRKFGDATLKTYQTDVMDYFATQGFVDVAAKFGANNTTVPTPASGDPFHATKMRLDYFLATPAAAERFKSIETVKTSLTDTISDHYPTIAVIE